MRANINLDFGEDLKGDDPLRSNVRALHSNRWRGLITCHRIRADFEYLSVRALASGTFIDRESVFAQPPNETPTANSRVCSAKTTALVSI